MVYILWLFQVSSFIIVSIGEKFFRLCDQGWDFVFLPQYYKYYIFKQKFTSMFYPTEVQSLPLDALI